MPSAGWRDWPFTRAAAKPVLEPSPGWVLGASERKGIARRLRRLLWRCLRREFEVEWLEGLRIELLRGNETSRAIFVTGCYEPSEFCLLQKILRPGMTFVDLGANMGLYSLFAARRVGPQGRVLAIEPSSREYEILSRNIERNRLANIRAVKVAASDRQGTAGLLIAPLKHAGHNTLGKFGYGTALERKEQVPTERLDDIMHRQGFERVDVIKMDVEGAEMLALRGAAQTLRRFHPLLLVEVSDRTLQHQGSSNREVLDLLANEGYRFYRFSPQTGLPVALELQPRIDAENVVAVAGDAMPW